MKQDRRFRFGVQAAAADSSTHWLAKVRAIEDNGYAMLGISDHFNQQLAAVPAMAAAAVSTTTLQIGATVLGNDFRHPAVLAKELATIDVLADGRSFIGLGAGWLRSDYTETGIAYDPAGIRIDRLQETVAVLKGLFADGPFSFQGNHYRIDALDSTPKPVQRPHPPIFIGGGGRRVLTFAAQQADIVGINVDLRGGGLGDFAAGGSSSGPIDEKVTWIREAAGERFADIELNVCVFTALVTDDREGVAREVAARTGANTEVVLATPNVLLGTVDQIVETLQQRRDRYEISNVMLPHSQLEQFAPVVERLADR